MLNPKLLAIAGLLTACLGQAQTPIGSTSYVPLNREQRWQRYWNETLLSPGLYFAAAGAAAGAQLAHDPPEWGQGFAAYSRRAASEFGTFMLQGTIHEGGSALLGYDPRYLRCNCSGALRRTAHAMEWTLLTKNNEGQTRLDTPLIAGAYGAGMISMLWYPKRYNSLTDGVRIGSQEVGLVGGLNILREFAPDLRRVFRLPKRVKN